MFTIPSPCSEEEDDNSLPELFLSQGSSQSEPSITTESSTHYVPGLSADDKPKISTTKPSRESTEESAVPKSTPMAVNTGTTFPQRSLGVNRTPLTNAGTPSSRAILVHPRQSQNPVLKYIDNCKHTISDQIVPDFVLSPTRCATFISLKFHTENPGYLETRFRNIPSCFSLKILLCFVDRPDSTISLQHISKLCIRHQSTLICAWSNLEAARYLETYKIFEKKPADSIMGKVEEDYESRLTDCLTSIRTVNKRDVKNLATTYGSLKRIMNADMEELAITEGLGTKKVKDIYYTFHKPFKTKKKASTSES